MSGKRRRRGKPVEQAEPDVPTPTYRTAAYVVFPTGYDLVHRDGKDHWNLDVVDAGNGWAIRRGDECLSIALQWEKERPPALCDAQFVRLEVYGLTFDDFAAQQIDEAAEVIEQAVRRIAPPTTNAPANPPAGVLRHRLLKCNETRPSSLVVCAAASARWLRSEAARGRASKPRCPPVVEVRGSSPVVEVRGRPPVVEVRGRPRPSLETPGHSLVDPRRRPCRNQHPGLAFTACRCPRILPRNPDGLT